MIHQQALALIQKHKLIAILRGLSVEDSLPVAKALYRGGIRVLEFTYDHDQPDYLSRTSEQVRSVCEEFGDELLVGCGTVLSTDEVEIGWKAGSRLMISPNTDADVIRRTRELDLISMPGAMTPTEIVSAYHSGADIVKLFPAGVLGPAYIKALRAPLRHIPMSAVGGITPQTAASFLDLGMDGLGVGSELVQPALVAAHNLNALTERAAEFVQAVSAWEAKR